MRVFAIVFAPLLVVACGNTYHPEYHPVTVTSYEQHVAGGQAGPVFPPPPPPTPAPWSAWPEE